MTSIGMSQLAYTKKHIKVHEEEKNMARRRNPRNRLEDGIRISQPEIEPSTDTEIILLPDMHPSEKDSYFSANWRDYDYESARENLQVIMWALRYLPRALVNRIGGDFLELADIMSMFSDDLENYSTSATIAERLGSAFRSHTLNGAVGDLKSQIFGLNDLFHKCSDRELVTVSPSHALSYLEMVTLNLGSTFDSEVGLFPYELPGVGVMVLDSHLDLVLSDKWASQRMLPVKSSVLAKLLDSQLVNGAAVLGVEVFNGRPTDPHSPMFNIDSAIVEAFKRHSDKLSFILSRDISRSSDTGIEFKRQVINEFIDSAVRKMKKIGCKILLMQVDMDVMNLAKNGIFTSEYSDTARLVWLSKQNLSDLLVQTLGRYTVRDIDNFFNQVSVDAQATESIQRALIKFLIRVNQKLFEGYSHGQADSNAMVGGGNKLGMDLETVIYSILQTRAACQKYGLDFGIKLPRGGIYYGGIYETVGGDPNGRGAHAVSRIINAMKGNK